MKTRNIALLIRTGNDWNRQVLMGIAQFANENAGWDFLHPKADAHGDVHLPEGWTGDGIICRMSNATIRQQVEACQAPAVNVSWLGSSHPAISSVTSDQDLCGTVIADYFLERRFEHFGFVGPPPWEGYHPVLEDSIRKSLSSRQMELSCLEFPVREKLDKFREAIRAWLGGLEQPTAITVWTSEFGRIVTSICVELELTIPDDVSIICIEHDDLASSLSSVPLSNLDQDPWRVGYTAAKTLADLMNGLEPANRNVLVPPLSVVQRRSSEASAVKDELVRSVYSYIHENVSDGLNVDDVIRHFGVSRRSLEKKFQDHLSVSPAQVIRRARMTIVKRLLRETSLTVLQIAERSGFSQAEVLMRAFKKETGLTTNQFRTGNVQCESPP